MIEAIEQPMSATPDVRRLRHLLAERRQARGWTQEELAERSGVSVRTIRNIETGSNKRPRRASVDLLLGAFGTSLAELAGAEGLHPGHEVTPLFLPRPRDGSGHWPHPVDPDRWRGPRPLTEAMAGRDDDLRHVLGTMRRGRLLVLTGPGGVGKTRLALTAAARLQERFRDGVGVVELGPCTPESADPAAARDQVHRAVDAVLADAAAREPGRELDLLLVVDNAEHVVATVSRLVLRLVVTHPGLRVLITSRRPLAVLSADVWEVSPLPAGEPCADGTVPHAADGSAEDGAALPAAVELFLRRARSTVPTLDLGSRLPQVAELCRRLDGLPRAIEAAAHCIRTVSLESLLYSGPALYMFDRFDLSAVSHHRTLADSVRWSYDLLTAEQRDLLHHLARSFDSFTVEDVVNDHPAGAWTAGSVVCGLAELADASLIRVHRGTRYGYRVYGWIKAHIDMLDQESGRTLGA